MHSRRQYNDSFYDFRYLFTSIRPIVQAGDSSNVGLVATFSDTDKRRQNVAIFSRLAIHDGGFDILALTSKAPVDKEVNDTAAFTLRCSTLPVGSC